ncbi:MAG: alpha/beta hydrolase [Xanthomonadales bacterium]
MTAVAERLRDSRTEVILVHGLWYGSWALRALSRRLRRDGFKIRHFAYPATSASLAAHAGRLYEFARTTQAKGLHFLGHSLGGLVILRMMSETPDLPPGRIVLLGSPLAGSIVARRLGNLPGSEKLLGEVQTALEAGYSRLPEERETGLIAGSRAIGLGLFMGGTGGPGDGTISLHETSNPGLQDRIVLPVSHSGLLYSDKVARHAANFLATGHF